MSQLMRMGTRGGGGGGGNGCCGGLELGLRVLVAEELGFVAGVDNGVEGVSAEAVEAGGAVGLVCVEAHFWVGKGESKRGEAGVLDAVRGSESDLGDVVHGSWSWSGVDGFGDSGGGLVVLDSSRLNGQSSGQISSSSFVACLRG